MIVVDASVVLEVLLRTPAAAAIQERILDPAETLHAPHLIDLEIAQVLRRYALGGLVDPDRCRIALSDLAGVTLNRYPHEFLLARIWQLRSNLTAYDAAYVALAAALDAPLLTRDKRLVAAPHHARVEII